MILTLTHDVRIHFDQTDTGKGLANVFANATGVNAGGHDGESDSKALVRAVFGCGLWCHAPKSVGRAGVFGAFSQAHNFLEGIYRLQDCHGSMQ